MRRKLREKKQLEHRPTDNERRGSWRSFNIERNFGRGSHGLGRGDTERPVDCDLASEEETKGSEVDSEEMDFDSD